MAIFIFSWHFFLLSSWCGSPFIHFPQQKDDFIIDDQTNVSKWKAPTEFGWRSVKVKVNFRKMETISEPLTNADDSCLLLDDKLLYVSPVHHLDQPNGIRRRCRSECLQMSPMIHRSNGHDNNGQFCARPVTDATFSPNGKRIFSDCFHHKDNSKENISMEEIDVKTIEFNDHIRYEKPAKKPNFLFNLSEEGNDDVKKTSNGHATIDENAPRRPRTRSDSEQMEFSQVPKQQQVTSHQQQLRLADTKADVRFELFFRCLSISERVSALCVHMAKRTRVDHWSLIYEFDHISIFSLHN